jgi:hypothetical protein
MKEVNNLKGELFQSKIVHFKSFYLFYPIYTCNDRNGVKMTSWKTCFKAYKTFKIQEFPGICPHLDLYLGFVLDPLGASRRPPDPLIGVTPPNLNSWIRPWLSLHVSNVQYAVPKAPGEGTTGAPVPHTFQRRYVYCRIPPPGICGFINVHNKTNSARLE